MTIWEIIAMSVVPLTILILLIRCPAACAGYVYCLVMGVVSMSILFGSSLTAKHTFAVVVLGCGIGAIYGMGFAHIIQKSLRSSNGAREVAMAIVVFPVLIFLSCLGLLIAGFIGLMIFWIYSEFDVFVSEGLVLLCIFGSLFGSVGSVVVVIVDT